MIRKRWIAFAVLIAFALVFWNFLDVIFCALISHTVYAFTPARGFFMPLAMAAAVGYLTILRHSDE